MNEKSSKRVTICLCIMIGLAGGLGLWVAAIPHERMVIQSLVDRIDCDELDALTDISHGITRDTVKVKLATCD